MRSKKNANRTLDSSLASRDDRDRKNGTQTSVVFSIQTTRQRHFNFVFRCRYRETRFGADALGLFFCWYIISDRTGLEKAGDM
jgi:hypothetical protein